MAYVLSLCDRTGRMVKPWVEAGFNAITVDLQEQKNPHPRRYHIRGSILDDLDLPPEKPVAVFAFPPCTHLASSGARWFRDKGLPRLIEALTLVNRCRELCEELGAPYMIENPIGTLSKYWREPDHRFDPYQFARYSPDPDADAYTKRTCLWVGNGFVMPDKRPLDPIMGSKMHLLPPSADRADLRSETPLGFAYAVFEANRKYARGAAPCPA